MDIASPYGKIAAALKSKPAQGSGTSDASKRDSRAFDMSPLEATKAKMKALGITEMPEGGAEQLEEMWADHVKKVNGAK